MAKRKEITKDEVEERERDSSHWRVSGVGGKEERFVRDSDNNNKQAGANGITAPSISCLIEEEEERVLKPSC